MKKAIIGVVLLLFAGIFFAGHFFGWGSRYREKDLVGKTSAEIEKEFGAFDCIGMPADADGLYKNTRCGYVLRAAKKGFLGTSEEMLLFITFNADGIAVNCEEGYRPGG